MTIRLICVYLLLGVYAVLTFQRVRIWHDDRSLWIDASRKAPCLVRPHANLALDATRRGDRTATLREWQEAIRLTLDPCP